MRGWCNIGFWGLGLAGIGRLRYTGDLQWFAVSGCGGDGFRFVFMEWYFRLWLGFWVLTDYMRLVLVGFRLSCFAWGWRLRLVS